VLNFLSIVDFQNELIPMPAPQHYLMMAPSDEEDEEDEDEEPIVSS